MNTSYYKHIILLFVTVMKCSSVTNRSYNNYFTTLPLLHYRESERGGGVSRVWQMLACNTI